MQQMHCVLSDFCWGEVGVAGTAGGHRSQFPPLVLWGHVLRVKIPRGDRATV